MSNMTESNIPDQPHNPMVNSGAIMSSSILLYLLKPEMNMAQKYDYVFDFFKVFIGQGWTECVQKMHSYIDFWRNCFSKWPEANT